jgi:hypothetical protein
MYEHRIMKHIKIVKEKWGDMSDRGSKCDESTLYTCLGISR